MRVGGLGLINSASIAAAVVIVTGFVGQFGTEALAGYGLGGRLELMLVPLTFGIGGALTVAVGTNFGAGQYARARTIALVGAGVVFLVIGALGVTVLARRFEESPFLDRYDGPNLVRGVYAGRLFPIAFSSDPVEKYWTLRRKSLLFDVPEKPVEISGPDAAAFLEHVLARRIETLEVGRGRYALALTPSGGIFMDGVVFRLGHNRFWYVQADGEFERWLITHSGGFGVAISDPRSRVLQIQGPTAIEVMKAA